MRDHLQDNALAHDAQGMVRLILFFPAPEPGAGAWLLRVVRYSPRMLSKAVEKVSASILPSR